MLTLLAALAFQVLPRPTWAVADLRDLKDSKSSYGRFAADAVAAELSRSADFEVIEGDRVNRSAKDLGLPQPLEGLIDLERVGQDLRASTIVSGEVVDYQVDPGGPARAGIRVIAYDVSSGLPINGALTVGVADFHDGLGKTAITQEAITRAVLGAVATLRRQQVPTAKIVNTTTRAVIIDRGARSGFRTGMVVILTRGSVQNGTGRIGKVEPTCAEISLERSGSIAPGDRVRAVFTPPALPPLGTSIFDRLPPNRPN